MDEKKRRSEAKSVADDIYSKYRITKKQRDGIEQTVYGWTGTGEGLVVALCIRFDLTTVRRRKTKK